MKILLLIIISSSFCFSSELEWNFIIHTHNNYTMNSIDNLDENNIMLIANDGDVFRRIYKSTDAGFNWEIAYKDPFRWDTTFPARGNDIEYVTKDYCIVACDSGRYLKTTDGGINWKEHNTGMIDDFHGFVNLSMFDENHGVMTSIYHMIVSHDGFETFEEVPVPDGYLVYDIEMVSPFTIHCLSRFLNGTDTMDVKFFSSKDGGHNWTEYYHPNYRLPYMMKFLDSLTGYNIGAVRTERGDNRRDIIYKTIDGGVTWNNIMDTLKYPSFGIQYLDIYDKENAIFVGQFGKIWRTTDGGNTFLFDSVPEIIRKLPPTMATCMLSPETSIICDYIGRIFRSSKITDVKEEIEVRTKFFNFPPYPIPARNSVQAMIFWDTQNELVNEADFAVYNGLGEKISGKEKITIEQVDSHNAYVIWDCASVKPGLYFIQVKRGDATRTIPVVVNR